MIGRKIVLSLLLVCGLLSTAIGEVVTFMNTPTQPFLTSTTYTIPSQFNDAITALAAARAQEEAAHETDNDLEVIKADAWILVNDVAFEIPFYYPPEDETIVESFNARLAAAQAELEDVVADHDQLLTDSQEYQEPLVATIDDYIGQSPAYWDGVPTPANSLYTDYCNLESAMGSLYTDTEGIMDDLYALLTDIATYKNQ